MSAKLNDAQLRTLRTWEPILIAAVRHSDAVTSLNAITNIQREFTHDRSHHRLLRAKNWYYGCLLAIGKTQDAKVGLEAVLKRAKEGTRLHIETVSQLAVCSLRLRLYDEAKQYLQAVIQNINAIASDGRRRQFQKRVIDRLSEEVILSQLIGRCDGELDAQNVQDQTVRLARERTIEELYEEVADLVPSNTPILIKDVQDHAIAFVPQLDRRMLESPKATLPKPVLGRRVMSAVQRILWRTLCADDSPICSLWKNKVPRIFNEGYFSLAIVTTLKEWRIGIPSLAAAGGAILMSKTCEQFCEAFKPEGLMIPRVEKPS